MRLSLVSVLLSFGVLCIICAGCLEEEGEEEEGKEEVDVFI